jgi:hypothetical protein
MAMPKLELAGSSGPTPDPEQIAEELDELIETRDVERATSNSRHGYQY